MWPGSRALACEVALDRALTHMTHAFLGREHVVAHVEICDVAVVVDTVSV